MITSIAHRIAGTPRHDRHPENMVYVVFPEENNKIVGVSKNWYHAAGQLKRMGELG